MASDEQFSLCWNNFHANMSSGFHGLLSRGDLVDVTLAAEGRLLQAHKLVLSVCSPFFQEMFKMNPTQHPIVFLKDVSHSALRDLLQFMYQGEVNVKQEELASFISTAEQLQVKGLTGNQNEESSTPSKPKPTSRPGPRSSQQRQSVMTKLETDLDSKTSTPIAVKRPNRPSIASNNSSSSQSGPAKRKCVDPLEAGPSGSAKEEFVTIPDEDENSVAPKMEPEFVNESMWDDDDDGANNDETNFGEDDSNMEMSGFDGSTAGDGNVTGGEGAVGDAQENTKSKHEWVMFYVTKLSDKKYHCNLCDCVFESKDEINVETLVEHFKADHKDVCELHKAELSPNVGFKIEFLQVVESSKQPVSQEITIQKEIDSTAVEDTENVHFVVINEDRTVQKKKKSESEGNETVSKFAKKKRSWVWKYFENISNFIFRCTLCNVVLSIKGSNTNNMNRHVKSKHPMIYKNELVLAGFTRKKESLEVTEVGSEVEITQSKVDLSDHDFAASTPMKADVSGDKDTSKTGRRSWIWGYFSRLSPTIAECTICKRKINHGGNATGNMNRHLKFLHKEIYLGSIIKSKHEEGKEIVDFVETEVDWVWTLFSTDDPVFYGCKICGFKCLKFNNISKSILFILEHLKTEHGVISGDQIISGPDAGDLDDECTIAVDFLKGTEEI